VPRERLQPKGRRPNRHGNHRWTQINTDKDYSTPRFLMAVRRSPDGDLKRGAARPESSPQNLCSSVSICGSLLHGYG
jgi:hypothetical protein